MRRIGILVAVVCCVVGLLAAMVGVVVWRDRRAADERARRDDEECAAMEASHRNAEEKNAALAAASQKRADEAAAAASASAKAAFDSMVAEIAAKPLAARIESLALVCPPNGDECHEDAIRVVLLSAQTPEETKALESAATNARKENAKGLRRQFASLFDQELLNQHLNPQSVEVIGLDGATMAVKGWFCSRQWVWDFGHSKDWEAARKIGITKMMCTSMMGETWSASAAPM